MELITNQLFTFHINHFPKYAKSVVIISGWNHLKVRKGPLPATSIKGVEVIGKGEKGRFAETH